MKYLQTFSYNVAVAKIFGVCSASFISFLDESFETAKRNKTLSANNTIILSRAEIYSRTGLDDEKQLEVEIALSECGVISTKHVQNLSNKNYYIFYENTLIKILEASKPEEVLANSEARQFIKGERVEPVSRRKSHIMSLKKKITVEDPVIQQYMCDWIDAVYTNPKGFLSPSAIAIAQQELYTYAKNDQTIIIELLKIAIKNGMRDMTWAIEQYEKRNSDNDSHNFVRYNDIKSDGSNEVREGF